MAKYVYGINHTLHSIDAKNAVKILISETFSNKEVLKVIKDSKVPYSIVRKEQILSLFKGVKNTQGIACEIKGFKTYDLSSVLKDLKSQQKSIILMLDSIEDPHNLGAILRIADAFSVDAVIYKKNNQVGLNEIVAKVSTGAINYVKVAQVSNLNNTLDVLKQAGYWVVSTDGSGTTNYQDLKYDFPVALIVGSEGFGISQLLIKNSDYVVKIPMFGHVNSLNASVATAILLSRIKADC
jgi:23S rRNA (guanosine2251-2'-O)-methyltransferase